jgi:hypothetical protein
MTCAAACLEIRASKEMGAFGVCGPPASEGGELALVRRRSSPSILAGTREAGALERSATAIWTGTVTRPLFSGV